ncbi:unnamed protein product [Calicophoron daubneyi]|uniref:Major facilitator superfamily (MFS) profile domain-containing protein n=1 Tax=Calicophoron daubneyi TaxID=300641 RepID=A0AAV2TH64_CALDB
MEELAARLWCLKWKIHQESILRVLKSKGFAKTSDSVSFNEPGFSGRKYTHVWLRRQMVQTSGLFYVSLVSAFLFASAGFIFSYGPSGDFWFYLNSQRLTSGIMVGGFIGNLLAFRLIAKFDSRKLLCLSQVIVILGWILTYYATDRSLRNDIYGELYSVSCLHGLSLGILFHVLPIYLNENSPSEHRTWCIVLAFSGLALGVWLCELMITALGWEFVTLVCGGAAVVVSVACLLLPRTRDHDLGSVNITKGILDEDAYCEEKHRGSRKEQGFIMNSFSRMGKMYLSHFEKLSKLVAITHSARPTTNLAALVCVLQHLTGVCCLPVFQVIAMSLANDPVRCYRNLTLSVVVFAVIALQFLDSLLSLPMMGVSALLMAALYQILSVCQWLQEGDAPVCSMRLIHVTVALMGVNASCGLLQAPLLHLVNCLSYPENRQSVFVPGLAWWSAGIIFSLCFEWLQDHIKLSVLLSLLSCNCLFSAGIFYAISRPKQ